MHEEDLGRQAAEIGLDPRREQLEQLARATAAGAAMSATVSDELAYLTLAEAVERIRHCSLSPVELTRPLIERIAADDETAGHLISIVGISPSFCCGTWI